MSDRYCPFCQMPWPPGTAHECLPDDDVTVDYRVDKLEEQVSWLNRTVKVLLEDRLGATLGEVTPPPPDTPDVQAVIDTVEGEDIVVPAMRARQNCTHQHQATRNGIIVCAQCGIPHPNVAQPGLVGRDRMAPGSWADAPQRYGE